MRQRLELQNFRSRKANATGLGSFCGSRLLYKGHMLSSDVHLVGRALLVWELFFLLNLFCAHYLMVLQIKS